MSFGYPQQYYGQPAYGAPQARYGSFNGQPQVSQQGSFYGAPSPTTAYGQTSFGGAQNVSYGYGSQDGSFVQAAPATSQLNLSGGSTGSTRPIARGETGTYMITATGAPVVLEDGTFREVDDAVGVKGPDSGRKMQVTTIRRANHEVAAGTPTEVHDYSEEIIKEANSTGIVKKQLADRTEELAKIVAAIEHSLQILEARARCDDNCDRDPIKAQLDNLLPSSTEDENGQRRDSTVGADADYNELKTLIADLKRRAALKESDYFSPLIGVLAQRADEALDAIKNTRNKPAEQEFIKIAKSIVDEFEKFMKLEVPKYEVVHGQAVAADADCGELEVQRRQVDWSQRMMDSEIALYTRVDTILKEAAKLCDASYDSLETLQRIRSGTLNDNLAKLGADAMGEADRLKKLRAEQEEKAKQEAAAFKRLQDDLNKAIKDSEAAAEVKAKRVAALSEQLRNILADLNAAQIDLWSQDKKTQVFRVALALLQEKHAANLLLDSTETGAIGLRLTDAAALQNIANIAHAMLEDIKNGMHGFEKERTDALCTTLYTLLVDRIQLTTRAYFKTALAVFAGNSRIEIKEQEKSAQLVKKERRNVAQDIAGVAECNRQVKLIEKSIEDERVQIEALSDRLRELAKHRSELQAALVDVAADVVDRRDNAGKLEVAFKDMVAELKRVEEQKHKSLYLSDLLDAAFL